MKITVVSKYYVQNSDNCDEVDYKQFDVICIYFKARHVSAEKASLNNLTSNHSDCYIDDSDETRILIGRNLDMAVKRRRFPIECSNQSSDVVYI